jgi:hypothetical protein
MHLRCLVTPCSLVDGYQCLEGPAFSSSGPLDPVLLLTTSALTLPYVIDLHTAHFYPKGGGAASSFPLVAFVTIYLYHITSHKITVLKERLLNLIV